MKSKKSGTEERKTAVSYPVRFTPENYETVKEKAQDCGLPLSEFIRRRSLGRQTRRAVDDRVINELRRLGGLQKKHFYKDGDEPNAALYKEILHEIAEAIRRIAAISDGKEE